MGLGGLGGAILALAGPSVSDAEAEAVVEAGRLDLGVNKGWIVSPNLEAVMTSGLDELDARLVVGARFSLIRGAPRSVVDVLALEGVDREARSVTVSKVGPERDGLDELGPAALFVVVVVVDDEDGASSAGILGELDTEDDFFGFCRPFWPMTSFFSTCPNVCVALRSFCFGIAVVELACDL